VAHVDVAVNIVRENKIKPGLVFDKSSLNESRILVAWLSPNTWNAGYRYGSVKFDFGFRKLVEGKRAYWVEVIDYSPAACRILITEKDHSATLQLYDPTLGDGPWWFDKNENKDYYNGKYCLEFMFEHEIELPDLDLLSFVAHHPTACSMRREPHYVCKEKGLVAGKCAAGFLGKIVANAVDLSLISERLIDDAGKVNNYFSHGLLYLAKQMTKGFLFTGLLESTSDDAVSIGRAAMNAVAIEHRAEAAILAKLFKSEDDLLRVVAHLVGNSLGVDRAAEIFDAMVI
jgi:hypothetical protein